MNPEENTGIFFFLGASVKMLDLLSSGVTL